MLNAQQTERYDGNMNRTHGFGIVFFYDPNSFHLRILDPSFRLFGCERKRELSRANRGGMEGTHRAALTPI